jgi:chromosome segregation ATPase
MKNCKRNSPKLQTDYSNVANERDKSNSALAQLNTDYSAVQSSYNELKASYEALKSDYSKVKSQFQIY